MKFSVMMILLKKALKHAEVMRFSTYTFRKSTIYALSSGHGKCGVAVIRVTGPKASNAVQAIAGFSKLPEPRFAHLRNFRNVHNGDIIDKGLVIWFPGPKSFTGEDSCEFQVHGSLAVVNGILNSLSLIPSFRIAEAGEFTRRAYFNGKLDLTEVEGLADLLNAETEIQRKQAFLQSQGFLSKLYLEWKNDLSKELAHIEASIDFEETENLDSNKDESIKNISRIKQQIETHLLNGRKGEILRHGVKTVILGKPNVGKSSLFNLLCGRPAAIVTSTSGTTRDVLEVRLDISGYPLILVDTAGLAKHSSDPIELEGMKRAVEQLDNADLIIVVMDASDYSSWKINNKYLTFKDYLKCYMKNLELESYFFDCSERRSKPTIFVMNKSDLYSVETENVVSISCKTEKGFDNFLSTIGVELNKICGEPTKEHPCMNKTRHRQHLEDCLSEQNIFIEKYKASDMDVVILAEHLRRALRHLGKLVGSTSTEDLLDIIFSEFCIGK
ncbi:hypothetical protein WA026_008915 [Henosepilachna vigintioctopunctata]|uniref:TrmE-type G domain-containing protein n=1 Tax=Henosepilachna vigintioctopunctata TaxID=420089 RepID=A0AAW1VDG3_9CUCU